MKYLTLFISALLLCSCHYDYQTDESYQELAGKRNREQLATKVAINFLNALGKETRGTRSFSDVDISSVYSWQGKDFCRLTRSNQSVNLSDTLMYIVNISGNNGYVLVGSYCDRMEVVAYIEEGNLLPYDSIENPGFRQYLEKLGGYLGYPPFPDTALTNPPLPFFPNDPPSCGFGSIDSLYPPILTTKWGQSEPFNNYCYNSIGEKCVAGCTPVAIGQIIAVFRPSTTYNGHTYLWDDMLSGYVPTNEAGIESAAHLIHDIGLLSGTSYSPTMTLTPSIFLTSPFYYFGFDFDISNYDFNKCLTNVSNGTPVYIDGFTTDTIGHSWVIDGALIWNTGIGSYDEQGIYHEMKQNYVHCNWGWFGLDNGYFLSGVFSLKKRRFDDNAQELTNVETANLNFSLMNTIIYNIELDEDQ